MENSTAPSVARQPGSRAGYFAAQVILSLLLVAISLIAVWAFRNSAAVIANCPWELDREEGFILQQAINISEGRTIYPSLGTYPLTVGNYTPLFPTVYGLTLLFTDPTLAVGRALVLASVIGICLVLFLFVIVDTKEPVPAILAVALFLANWDVMEWIRYARVDFPALLFTSIGLLLATRERWKIFLPLSVMAFLLAFFTKQTQVVAPAALVLAFSALGLVRRAAFLAGSLVVLTILISSLLTLLTKGEFLRHTVFHNANVFHWDQVSRWILHLFMMSKWIVFASVIGLGIHLFLMPSKGAIDDEDEGIARAALNGRVLSATMIFYLLAAFSLILTTGKDGAAANYLIEIHLAMALVFSHAVGRLLLHFRQQEGPGGLVPTLRLGVCIVLLCLHALSLHVPWRRHVITQRPLPSPSAVDSFSRAVLMISESPGDVLSELPLLAMMARKEVVYQPYIMSTLAKEGKWDEAPMIADLIDARFSIIVTTQRLEREKVPVGFSPTMREAILFSYRYHGALPLDGGKRLHIYTPAPRQTRNLPPYA